MNGSPRFDELRELYAKGELTCEAAGDYCKGLCTIADLRSGERVVKDPDCFR